MTIAELLDRMAGLRALVVGDLMLDEYIDGTATRISPEAPVMVVRQKGRRTVPGGAANVARNAAALGAVVQVVGLVGDDEGGRALEEEIASLEGCTPRLVVDPSRVTTRKTRVLAGGGQQVLRIDHEETHPASGDAAGRLCSLVAELSSQCDLVILSDYMKGVLIPGVAASIRAPFASVNAKPATARFYPGLSLLSLNRPETEGLVGRDLRDLDGALAAAEEARAIAGVKCVVATMGSLGCSAAWEGGGTKQEAPEVEVADVTGAGDTLIAAASLAAAAVGFRPEVFRLAAEAASRVVQHRGVVAPSVREVMLLRTLE